jgi:hypothetical protein
MCGIIVGYNTYLSLALNMHDFAPGWIILFFQQRVIRIFSSPF